MDNKSFADNLRRLRLEKGYTQEKLAKKLGVAPQSVSRWECGATLPDVMLLPTLAQLYGVTVDDFYREDANPYPNLAQRLLAVYEATGRSEDFLVAEREFEKLIARSHTADDLRTFGVLYHYMTKRSASLALDYLDAAMNMAEENSWVRYSAAQQRIALLCDLGRGAEEAEHYGRELQADSDNVHRWLLAIAAHHFANKNERALELAKDAISRFPGNPTLYVYAGDICRELKLFDLAFAYWQQSMAMDKAPLDPYYSMGFCYEELGQYENAYQVWRELRQELIDRGLTQEQKLPAEHMSLCEKRLG